MYLVFALRAFSGYFALCAAWIRVSGRSHAFSTPIYIYSFATIQTTPRNTITRATQASASFKPNVYLRDAGDVKLQRIKSKDSFLLFVSKMSQASRGGGGEFGVESSFNP